MYVLNVAIPDPASKIYIPTRLVIGCEGQATVTADALKQCGLDVEMTQSEKAPERSEDETLRANELMALLYWQPQSVNA